MTEGTKSYLFGCHQFLIHPIIVVLAWQELYKRMPKFWELVCIFLHDVGHVGKEYLTYYEEKKKHWKMGARIAYKLFGLKGFHFIAGHTSQSGYPRTRLYWADKYSWTIAPRWWLRLNDKIEGFDSNRNLDDWLALVKDNWNNGCPIGTHQIYLNLKEKGEVNHGNDRSRERRCKRSG
jgi:hypothetical protein